MKLIILQGIPASGKSTIATEWQAQDPSNRIIVSRDALRHARGQYWIPTQENLITRLELFMVQESLADGLEVMIDATNFNPAYLKRFHTIAAQAGLTQVEHWLVHTSLDECVSRDGNADRPHHVGETVISSFYGKYVSYCRNNDIKIVPGTITKTSINVSD